MKKYVVMSLALMIGSLIFAQKKEIKAVEKAIKSGNFADAKSNLQLAEGFLSTMDEKTKAKFYFLKGQALYAGGNGTSNDITEAINAFEKAKTLENTIGKKVFTPQVEEIKQGIVINLAEKGQKALDEKNYTQASNNFEQAYRVSKLDTTYLFNAALLAQNGKDYDRTLKIYDELITLGYTGIYTEFLATEIETGEEQPFQNKQIRDAFP